MKGYYLFAPIEEGCAGSFSGVEKKIRSQHKVLNSKFKTELIVLPVTENTIIDKITTRLPFFSSSSRKWKYTGEFNDADFIYIRQVRHDRSFLNYIKNIKRQNTKIKILYEVPTYPYEAESHVTLKNFHVYIKSRINTEKLHNYIDRVITFYGQDRIFNIETIKTINGFDFDSLNLPQHRSLKKEEIHVIEVSTTAFWHGYDRFITGLRNYYADGGAVNIIFHMVGDILPELERMIYEYHLEDHVILHGRKSGEELNEIYDICSLAIDVLGGHRKNYPISSSLKSREYAAKGLPIVTSSPVDYIGDNCEWQLIVPYDDSPINITSVINFYNACYSIDCCELMNKIRQYAIAKCGMEIAMKPIIDYLTDKQNL